MKSFSELLAMACQAAPSADNAQPCRFHWDGQKLTIGYDSERVANTTFPADNPATLLTAGATIENICQLTRALGLESNINYWPQGKTDSAIYANITIEQPPERTDNSGQNAWLERHTNRGNYQRTALPVDLIQSLTELSEGDSRLSAFTAPVEIKKIAGLVKSASEIRFQTREVHEWLAKSLRFTPEQVATGDGLDVNTLGLPPGGSLFLKFICNWKWMRQLNRIGAYKLLAAADSQPVKVAPALVAITGSRTMEGAIRAGRLLCRSWIYLNARGVAAHPYYVVSDQLARLHDHSVPNQLLTQARDIETTSKEIFSLPEDHTLYMLLRIGTAKKAALKSRRLTTKRVFSEGGAELS